LDRALEKSFRRNVAPASFVSQDGSVGKVESGMETPGDLQSAISENLTIAFDEIEGVGQNASSEAVQNIVNDKKQFINKPDVVKGTVTVSPHKLVLGASLDRRLKRKSENEMLLFPKQQRQASWVSKHFTINWCLLSKRPLSTRQHQQELLMIDEDVEDDLLEATQDCQNKKLDVRDIGKGKSYFRKFVTFEPDDVGRKGDRRTAVLATCVGEGKALGTTGDKVRKSRDISETPMDSGGDPEEKDESNGAANVELHKVTQTRASFRESVTGGQQSGSRKSTTTSSVGLMCSSNGPAVAKQHQLVS